MGRIGAAVTCLLWHWLVVSRREQPLPPWSTGPARSGTCVISLLNPEQFPGFDEDVEVAA